MTTITRGPPELVDAAIPSGYICPPPGLQGPGAIGGATGWLDDDDGITPPGAVDEQ